MGKHGKCKVCKTVMKIVAKLVKNKKSRSEIQHALDHVCHEIPKVIRRPCSRFVSKHGKEIVDKLVNGIKPDKVIERFGHA